MTSPTREELRSLRDHAEPPCVSIHLPTGRSAVEIPKNRIRLKNLLRDAEEQLSARGERHTDELLAPARRLIDDVAFWQQTGEGLALYLAKGTSRHFQVGEPLPQLAVVGNRFHFAPLLPLMGTDGHYHVLALSQKNVRLFAAGREGAHEIALGGLPRSVQEALHYDESEHALQFHSVPSTPQTIGSRGRAGAAGQAVTTGRRQGMFHGHGTVDDDAKEQVERFFQLLAEGLEKVWRLHAPPLPLVLAGVEYEQAMFRAVSRHPRIVAQGIEGNVELLSGEELRDRAQPLVGPALHEEERRAAATFQDLAGTPRASSDLEEVLLAAADGRVDALFCDTGVQRWGRFDTIARTVEVHPSREAGDEDLVDRAATEAVFHGGRVYAVRPGEGIALGPVAAVFRY
jgi:hypothetical protein